MNNKKFKIPNVRALVSDVTRFSNGIVVAKVSFLFEVHDHLQRAKFEQMKRPLDKYVVYVKGVDSQKFKPIFRVSIDDMDDYQMEFRGNYQHDSEGGEIKVCSFDKNRKKLSCVENPMIRDPGLKELA